MVMECPKGEVCSESNHEVKTLDGAREWYPSVNKPDLPVKVRKFKGAGGRLRIMVFAVNGKLIHSRG
jgi:hypothetical protein